MTEYKEYYAKDGDREICFWDSRGPGWPILLLHGNSAAKNSFTHQINDSLLKRHRIIALDLPGHGQSSWAADYNTAVYTGALKRIIAELQLSKVVLIGHSLGGNIVIEAADEIPEARGVVAFGAAPLSKPPDVARAFLPHSSSIAFFTADLSKRDYENWAQTCFMTGFPIPDHFVPNIQRTDPKVRACLVRDIQRLQYKDEVQCLNQTIIPHALWHGEYEKTISFEYLDGLKLPALWRDKVVVIKDAGHSPHIEQPKAFNQLIDEFIESLS